MTHDVFITYSSKDRATGDAVCAALEAREIDCWIAPRNLLPGRSWGGAIIEALEQSRFLVLVYTSNSNNSQQVLREIERAVSKNITIIPLRLDITPLSTDLEYFLSSCHWMDAVSPPLEKHLEKLADVVDRLPGKKKRAEPLDRFTPKSMPAAAKRPAWLLPAVAAVIVILYLAVFFLFIKPDTKKTLIEKQALTPIKESVGTPVVRKIDQKPATEMVQIPVVRKVAQKPIVDEITRKPAEGAVRIPVVYKVAQKPILEEITAKPTAEVTQRPSLNKVDQRPVVERIDQKPAVEAPRTPMVHKIIRTPAAYDSSHQPEEPAPESAEKAVGTSTSVPVGRMLNENEW